ncbi:MAG: hypothetical protein IT376_07505 [Polyangiaceae bacterium]|nr:hypothetical protein [Polyangiaceae bacterium]
MSSRLTRTPGLRPLRWAAVIALAAASCADHEPELGRAGGGPLPDSGGAHDAAADASGAGLPCEVEPVVTGVCQRCHSSPPAHGAPFPLRSSADFGATYPPPPSAFGRPIHERAHEAVETGFMPLINVAAPLDPPVEPLEPAEKQALLEWLAAGAPAGACP